MNKLFLILILLLFFSCNDSTKNKKKAEIFLAQENYDKALDEINKAIQLNKDNASFYVIRAIIYDYLEEYESEVSDLTTIISLEKNIDNNRFNAYSQRAYVLTQLGHYEKALTDIDFYIDNNVSGNSLSDAYINKASILCKLNDFINAKNYYQLSIDENTQRNKELYLQAYIGLANLETDPNTALKILENKLLENDSSSILLFTKSSINYDLGKINEAYKGLIKVYKINPKDPNVNYVLGQIHYTTFNNYDSAEMYFNNAISYSLNNESFDVIYNKLGNLMNIKGKHHEALKFFELAEEHNTNSDVTLYNYSMTLYDLGENDQALLKINKAINLNSTNFEYYNSKGSILAELGRFNESESSYLKSVEINPTDGGGFYNLGYLYGEQSNHKEAIKYYTKAIALNYDLEATLVNRAIEKANLNQINSACKDLKKAYKLGRKDILPIINKMCK
jgi:tetratricopeptide (TPR) repeat protein